MSDLSIHDDVPARAANAALVGDATGLAYENRIVIPVDLTGATGVMIFSYNVTSGEAELLAMVPTLASANATDAGRVWVANGAYYEDKLVSVVLSGSGAPTSGDGWDGAFWRDLVTNIEYGPKGTAIDGTPDPGVWDTTPAGQGRRTKANLGTLPSLRASIAMAGGSILTGVTEILTVSGATTVGTWAAPVANGQAVPEAGNYILEATVHGYGDTSPTLLETHVQIDGTEVAAPICRAKATKQASEYATFTLSYGPVALTSGQVVGYAAKPTGGAMIVDIGYFSLRRVS